jgi:hypothetical protein
MGYLEHREPTGTGHGANFGFFVTNERNTVEVLLKGGARVLLSPDEPEEFVKDVLSTLSS